MVVRSIGVGGGDGIRAGSWGKKKSKTKADKLRALLPLLTVIKKADEKDRKTLLSFMNKEAVSGLCECLGNCLYGGVSVVGGELDESAVNTIEYLLEIEGSRDKHANKKSRAKLMEISTTLDPILNSTIPRIEQFLGSTAKTRTLTTKNKKKKQ